MRVRRSKINHQPYTNTRRKASQNREELAQAVLHINQYQAQVALVDLKMEIWLLMG
jgi:hypothetical protein